MGFPGGSDHKESACNVGGLGSITELGRSLEEGHGNPLQSSYLENSMDRGNWWATVQGVAKSDTPGQLTLSLSLQSVMFPLHYFQFFTSHFNQGYFLN